MSGMDGREDLTVANRAPDRDAQSSQEDGPRFLPMIGLVAVSVAITILVFFGVGYLFGRLFL